MRDFFMLTGSACSGGNFVLTVKADGTVQPCPFVDDIPLGSIGTECIWTIYARRDTRCLGPFREPIVRDRVCDRVPCFF